MECTLSYSWKAADGREAAGAARAVLDGESLTVLPVSGEDLSFPLRQILTVEAADYRISLHLAAGEEMTLSGLGYAYEDFLRGLFALRNELFLKDLLMDEKLKRAGTHAEFIATSDGAGQARGACEVRLYETALVILS